MRALVTGGAGFIGSHLTEALVSKGWEAFVIDDLSTGLSSNLSFRCTMIAADAGTDRVLDEVLPGTDALFHLAAVSSVQDALDRPLAVHEVNLTMTLKLLEAAVRHKVKRFVFSSSAAIYGDTEGRPAKENMLPRPLSHYAVQKLACEHYCQAYGRLHGLETVCLRYFNVYGPRQRPDSPYSGVISRFLDAGQQGHAINILGDGAQTRDFVHVSDVARANLLAATAPAEAVAGKVFNVGTGHTTPIQDVADQIRQIFPGTPSPTHGEARKGEIRYSRACTDLAKTTLGFETQVDFASGIRELIAHSGKDRVHSSL
jgi:nucleoside-diphosphate-sugar epimerase